MTYDEAIILLNRARDGQYVSAWLITRALVLTGDSRSTWDKRDDSIRIDLPGDE